MDSFEEYQNELKNNFFKSKINENTDWETTQKLNTKGAYLAYIKKYPNGKYVFEANILIDEFDKKEKIVIEKENPIYVKRISRIYRTIGNFKFASLYKDTSIGLRLKEITIEAKRLFHTKPKTKLLLDEMNCLHEEFNALIYQIQNSS